MVDVRMPDGAVVRFPDDMPREQIRGLIANKFPQVAQQQQAQAAPVPMRPPSFRMGNQEIIPPMPRPRPAQGGGDNANWRTYEVRAPDGRTISIRAVDQATAVQGAKQWVSENPASSQQPQPQQAPQAQQTAGDMVRININGKRVKVGREFLQMSPDMQNQTVDEIAGQMGMLPNGNATNPLNFGGGQPTQQPGNGAPMQKFEVKTPDGQIFEVTAPDMASASASVQEYLAGAGGGQPAAQGPSQQWLQQNPSLADLPIPGSVGANAPRPAQGGAQPRTGAFENATAGLNDALYRVAGLPVDAANTALRIGAAGVNAATGSDIQLPVDTIGGHQSIADAFGRVGVTDPANVVPANNFEKSLRAGGEGAGYAVAPELVFAQLSKLGIVGAKAQQLMGQIFGEARTLGSTTGNMVAGATGGMGAQIAADAAPEEWKGTAAVGGGLTGAGVGTLATQLPRLAGAGGRAIGDFLAPFTQGGREQMAGQQLRKGSTSPGAVIDAIANAPTELVPGSKSGSGAYLL